MSKASYIKTKQTKTDRYILDEKDKGDISLDYSDESTIEEEEGTTILAYRTSWLGTFMFALFCLETVGHIGYMIMVTQDYYTSYSAFRGNSVVATSTFMGMWYVLFGWFASLTVFRHRLLNFFRIRCSYKEGQYVQVERKESGNKYFNNQTHNILNRAVYI